MKKKGLSETKFPIEFGIYFLFFFVLFIGGGELLSHFLPHYYNPLSDSQYTPAIVQFKQINDFSQKYGAPDCIISGNSLVQAGIAPNIFSQALQKSSNEKTNCYNLGMDGSTMSSTVPMAIITANLYKPSYLIIGVQAYSFMPRTDIDHLAENNFGNDHWVRYSLGNFDPPGWIREKFALYGVLRKSALKMFAAQNIPPALEKAGVHPEVPRKISDDGYGPLTGYRDASPLFQKSNEQEENAYFDIDPQDFAALNQIMEFSQRQNIHLIFVEMPINNPPPFFEEINSRIRIHVRQHGIPYLSTANLVHLPASAYSDQIHLQVSGSIVFSEWLGMQLGEIIAKGGLSEVNSPLWSPFLQSWPRPTYISTFGLSETSHKDFLESYDKFDLLPPDAILFNPSKENLDKQFLQSSVGFTIDYKNGVTEQERENLFQLITIMGKMSYQSDLQLSRAQESQLEQWNTSIDPKILNNLGIRYILCRVELAAPNIRHCPSGIENNPNYSLVKTWAFDPLYEKYFLYKIFSSN